MPVKSQNKIEKDEREEEIRKKEINILEKHLERRKYDEEKIKKWSFIKIEIILLITKMKIDNCTNRIAPSNTVLKIWKNFYNQIIFYLDMVSFYLLENLYLILHIDNLFM